MKRIFDHFDHFWSLHESASHATSSASRCQQASSFHQIVGRPDILSVIGYLILFQGSIAVLYPAISTYINERSPERQRATVLSFQTGLFSAAMIVLFPLFGVGVSHVPYILVYQWTLIALATGSLVIGVAVWLCRR